MNIVILIILLVLFVASVIIKKDTRELIHRSEELQKTLNKLIKKELK